MKGHTSRHSVSISKGVTRTHVSQDEGLPARESSEQRETSKREGKDYVLRTHEPRDCLPSAFLGRSFRPPCLPLFRCVFLLPSFLLFFPSVIRGSRSLSLKHTYSYSG